ncbi:hypothetical protein F2Q70_00002860 [Brassica cretica]|uniref:Uncharacterized protein n=1 Tax=Brassica cretica TaxID=69181 RepID=A0A8S9IK12_BRACR|nr:hypothetical protein F2Q70_00002860 [Brassica cretica]
MVTSGDPELRPASVPAPPQRTSELQAPPSPRHRQKPRASHLRQRISGPSSTRPRSDIGETVHPTGSEYGFDLSGTQDRRTTGAMSCLREAC